jgi:hypothetical protein
MIATAIDEAVEQTKALLDKAESRSGGMITTGTAATQPPVVFDTKPIHHTNLNADAVDVQLRQLVHSKYGGCSAFFEAAKGKGGVIGRTAWKSAMKMAGLDIGNTARKELRKRIAGLLAAALLTCRVRERVIYIRLTD